MHKYFLGLLCVPLMAFAQPSVQHVKMSAICSSTEDVTKWIESYGEIKLWSAVESATIVVSLWQNLETKSYTVTKTEIVKGIMCVISMGGTPKQS